MLFWLRGRLFVRRRQVGRSELRNGGISRRRLIVVFYAAKGRSFGCVSAFLNAVNACYLQKGVIFRDTPGPARPGHHPSIVFCVV